MIEHQKMSSNEFDKKLAEYKKTHGPGDARLEDLLPTIKEAFGLHVMQVEGKEALEKAIAAGKVEGAADDLKKAGKHAEKKLKQSLALTELEIDVLRDALAQSMLSEKERAKDDHAYLLYGGYEPLSAKLTTILNNKSGIG